MIQKEWSDFILEIDSKVAYLLINDIGHSEHHLAALIQDCKAMLIQGHGYITHAYRRGKSCTDFLANG